MSRSKTRLITLTDAVRGELRTSGEVVTYDLEAGEHPVTGIHPAVLERLLEAGTATQFVEKKESR